MTKFSWSTTDPQVRQVVVASLTLGGTVGVFALSFGVAAVSAGATVAQTCALSLFVFTGASQFSAMSVVGAGGSLVAAFSGAVLLAARNLVYGLSLSASADSLAKNSFRKFFAAHFVIDETTAMALAQQDPRLRRVAFWVTGIGLFTFWNIGTLIGALAGSAIDPEQFGLDIALPAAFVVMLMPHLQTSLGRKAAFIGAGLCLVSIPFVPIGVPVLLASIGVLVGLKK